ncbi:ABC transporter ATP-binding protein [uncultured Vagococcus sp.]|uniref:ABC transporter ATP-binding protein n=1 Tax=uncultured Vagococcus sp. TaxID=189676 RepID=UPI00258DC2E1|nr:ABC transporter ATP-binding protein [uncultured Vagococcus sp.]
MKIMLEATNITKNYQDNTTIVTGLNNVSLIVEKSEFVAIMGTSGSGKSTLMHSLSGLDRVDEGEIIVANQVISNMTEDELTNFRRLNSGFVFQQPTLIKNLNLLDNIILPSLNHSKISKEELIEKANKLMTDMGIGELGSRGINQVSGGQLQRAGICRALINQPKIIFADEPTGALNSKASEEIMILLENINQKGTTILLVTHDIKVAASADRVLLMKDGNIIDDKKFEKIEKNKRILQITDWLTEHNI